MSTARARARSRVEAGATRIRLAASRAARETRPKTKRAQRRSRADYAPSASSRAQDAHQRAQQERDSLCGRAPSSQTGHGRRVGEACRLGPKTRHQESLRPFGRQHDLGERRRRRKRDHTTVKATFR